MQIVRLPPKCQATKPTPYRSSTQDLDHQVIGVIGFSRLSHVCVRPTRSTGTPTYRSTFPSAPPLLPSPRPRPLISLLATKLSCERDKQREPDCIRLHPMEDGSPLIRTLRCEKSNGESPPPLKKVGNRRKPHLGNRTKNQEIGVNRQKIKSGNAPIIKRGIAKKLKINLGIDRQNKARNRPKN